MPCKLLLRKGFFAGQESNLYFTLRRHAHYPLCYGEISDRDFGSCLSRARIPNKSQVKMGFLSKTDFFRHRLEAVFRGKT